MEENLSRDRLQPFLLDRLTDDQRELRNESRDQRVMILRQLHQAVLRDLEWLLNTPRHTPDEEIYDFPMAAKSVLNFGMPSLSGLSADSMDLPTIERMITDTIQTYEPRVIPQSLQVRAVSSNSSHNLMSFEIRADIWAVPMPDRLFVRTELDLESGHCRLQEKT